MKLRKNIKGNMQRYNYNDAIVCLRVLYNVEERRIFW